MAPPRSAVTTSVRHDAARATTATLLTTRQEVASARRGALGEHGDLGHRDAGPAKETDPTGDRDLGWRRVPTGGVPTVGRTVGVHGLEHALRVVQAWPPGGSSTALRWTPCSPIMRVGAPLLRWPVRPRPTYSTGHARSMIDRICAVAGSVPNARPASPPSRLAQYASATAGTECSISSDACRSDARRSTIRRACTSKTYGSASDAWRSARAVRA